MEAARPPDGVIRCLIYDRISLDDKHDAHGVANQMAKLEHLVNTRNARCLAPGCGRPAARCDKDHTVAWLNGGLTCECKLAPTCKR